MSFTSPRPTAQRGPASSAPRTATCRRRPSCRSARRRPSRGSTPTAARARHDDPARQHLPPALPPRRRRRRGARRPAPLHGLGRPDPDRLGRLPGLLAARHDRPRRRRGRHVPLRLRRRARRASRRSSAADDPAAARLGHRHVPRRLPARRRCRRPSSRSRSARTTRWAERQLAAPRADGQLALRDRAGRHRPGAPPPLHRGDRRARLRRQRARRPERRGGPRDHARHGRAGRRRSCRRTSRATSWASATRPAILEVVERGIDMFDCVLPTRLGRTGRR